MERIKNFFKDESGVSAVEYALMAAVVAGLLLVGVRTFYTGLGNIFNDVTQTIESEVGGS